MKKQLLALSIILFLAACNNGGMKTKVDEDTGKKPDNPFVGTWESEDGWCRLVFTETDIVLHNRIDGVDDNGIDNSTWGKLSNWSTTYTYTDTEIIIAQKNYDGFAIFEAEEGDKVEIIDGYYIITIPYDFSEGYSMRIFDAGGSPIYTKLH